MNDTEGLRSGARRERRSNRVGHRASGGLRGLACSFGSALSSVALALLLGPGPLAAQVPPDGEPRPDDGTIGQSGAPGSLDADGAGRGEPGPDVPGSGPDETGTREPGALSDELERPDAATPEAVRGGMIPREALVDMARMQSGLVCESEVFLGCMGFDGTTCHSLSETAVERCLMTLPAEIDPTSLDSAPLEACPKAIYEEAGYVEDEARVCLNEAFDEF